MSLLRSYFFTGLIALVLGIGLGLYLGWIQFPSQYTDGQMCQLEWSYQESYTLMVARGYRQDRNLNKALDRLRPLRAVGVTGCENERPYKIDNIPDWVQYFTEQQISRGADPQEIRDLVVLADAFDRLTPIMEGFLSEP